MLPDVVIGLLEVLLRVLARIPSVDVDLIVREKNRRNGFGMVSLCLQPRCSAVSMHSLKERSAHPQRLFISILSLRSLRAAFGAVVLR